MKRALYLIRALILLLLAACGGSASDGPGQAAAAPPPPLEWQVTTGSRFPDLMVQADAGFRVARDRSRLAQQPLGVHDWDPTFMDMHGIFTAAGPRLPVATTTGSISNVDIYPLMLELLEIPLAVPVDGNSDVLLPLLKD